MTSDVLVMGGGATGQLAAAYLRMRFPDLRIAVVEGPQKNRPIVGESLVEVSVDFFLELGLGAYLVENHYPKYGLTYYFKLKNDDPADRRYIVDEIPTAPPLLSFQINRFTFDEEVRRRNLANGVQLIDGTVTAVDIQSGGGLHAVTAHDSAGQTQTLSARWIIDATGRNRLLAKQFHLQETVKQQKSVFWFRLKNFNPEILSRIDAVKQHHRNYVPYFATHHFFGKGNWIWFIPMRSSDGQPLVSIGITYRKDVFAYGEVRTMEQFLACVAQEHPVIAELVRSGTVADTNFYGSYMWECRQRYSSDGWYIIGDAGDTVDPLYSVGLALSSVQIRQIAAIVERQLRGEDTDEFTKNLDTAIAAFQRAVTRDTARLYECMGDAYQCHLRVHLVVVKLFHLALPFLLNDYLWDPLGVKLVNWFSKLETLEADFIKFHELIREVAANPKNRGVQNFIKVQSAESMNYPFYEHHREEDIPSSLSRLSWSLARLRLALLRKLGWRGLICFSQQGAFWKDVFRGLVLVPFHGRKLRKSWLAGRIFSQDEPGLVGKERDSRGPQVRFIEREDEAASQPGASR